jgi:hypothetical protein
MRREQQTTASLKAAYWSVIECDSDDEQLPEEIDGERITEWMQCSIPRYGHFYRPTAHPELCVCVACRVTLKIGESAGNINKHFATEEHQAKINSGHLDEFGGAVERIADVLLEICEFGRPFTLVDSPHMDSLVRSPFRLNATIARQLLVSAGCVVIKLIPDELGAKRLVGVFAKTDGWSRFQHMEKMAGTALRGLFFDGSTIERFVSMRLYEESSSRTRRRTP